jgi:acetyl esterase
VDATVQALTALAGPVVLMGDSAGGTLAAVAAQLARDRGASLVRACVLYCPAPDLAARGGSLEVFGREFFPRAETLAWFLSCYLERPEDSLNPLASPARHPHLDHLPPTLVVSAEYDPLRDSAEAYARALAAAGTAVVARRWDGMPHDFVLFPGPHSRAVLEATRAYLDGVADR